MTVGQVEYLQDLCHERLRIFYFHISCIGFIYFRQVKITFGQLSDFYNPLALTDKCNQFEISKPETIWNAARVLCCNLMLGRAMLHLLPGPGRSWIAGPAGISRLGPNSEPRGNNRSFPETRERHRVPVKIRSRDSIFGLVNSTYSFEITNHNQLVSNIKYLANFIKKYWTYFRYQKLADFLVRLPPSVRV